MIRMVRECDRSQQRLAIFLVAIVTLEVTIITSIIKREHTHAHKDWEEKEDLDKNMKKNATILSKTGKHQTGTHFTFGNEPWKPQATYQCDYSCAKAFPSARSEKKLPPVCAEVIPNIPREIEKGKWASATMRDFSGFGEYYRRQAFDAVNSALNSNKAWYYKDIGLLQENFRLPMTTIYGIDYSSGRCGAQMPRFSYKKDSLNTNTNTLPSGRRHFITESQYSFRWPSADRSKLPPHFRRHFNPN